MWKYSITKYVADKRTSLILHELLKYDKNVKILDVGCGNQYIANKIRTKGYKVVGIDKDVIHKPDFVMDAQNMDFEDNSFDFVIALEVIEHCDCISEIKRVLKEKGIFCCSTPTNGTDWIRSILVKTKLLENQDFESHSNIIDLRKIPLKILKYKKMFLNTSQFGVFEKE